MHSCKNRRILIVDDNPSIQNDFCKILGDFRTGDASLDEKEAILFGQTSSANWHEGFEIESAYQGEEALKMIMQARQQDAAVRGGFRGRPHATWLGRCRNDRADLARGPGHPAGHLFGLLGLLGP